MRSPTEVLAEMSTEALKRFAADQQDAGMAAAAAAELDRRGVEPETIPLDDAGVAGDHVTYGIPFSQEAHPPTRRNAADTADLRRFRVDPVIYAPSRAEAERRLREADIYLDAAALEPESDARIEPDEIVAVLERLQGRSWPGAVDDGMRQARGALMLLAAGLLTQKAREGVAA